MARPTQPDPDLLCSRAGGPLGFWADGGRALVLLALLALASIVAGWGTGSARDGNRDGLSADDSRPYQATFTVLSARIEADHPHLTGTDTGPVLSSPAAPVPGGPLVVAVRPAVPGWTGTRAGHAARMPTGPPSVLST